MFAIFGVGVVSPNHEVKEVPLKNGKGSFFNFRVLTKDPYKPTRHCYRISCFVRTPELEKARAAFKAPNCLEIRGDLESVSLESGALSSQIKTRWEFIQKLTKIPDGDRKRPLIEETSDGDVQ